MFKTHTQSYVAKMKYLFLTANNVFFPFGVTTCFSPRRQEEKTEQIKGMDADEAKWIGSVP